MSKRSESVEDYGIENPADKLGKLDTATGQRLKWPKTDLIGGVYTRAQSTVNLGNQAFVVLPMGLRAATRDRLLRGMKRYLGLPDES